MDQRISFRILRYNRTLQYQGRQKDENIHIGIGKTKMCLPQAHICNQEGTQLLNFPVTSRKKGGACLKFWIFPRGAKGLVITTFGGCWQRAGIWGLQAGGRRHPAATERKTGSATNKGKEREREREITNFWKRNQVIHLIKNLYVLV